MLCLFVELVRNVVSTFQMRSFPLKRDWHTPDDEAALPRVKTDTHQEANTAAQHRSPIALIPSSAQSARPSKHEGVLTTVSHTHNGSVNSVHASPAKAGVQSSSDKSARSAPNPFAPSLVPGLRRGCVLRERANKP